MPGRNGTGPEGMGAMTGRGLGNCSSNNTGENTNTARGGMGMRRGGGRGMGRGMGMRRGGGRGMGRGMGFASQTPNTSPKQRINNPVVVTEENKEQPE